MPGRITFCAPFTLAPTPPPKRWSFSSIRSFSLCPLRWAISNSCTDQTKRSFSVATIEGNLLHQLIQSYFERDPSQPFRPRKALLQLISEYPDQYPDDKIAVKALVQKASFQDIIFGFIKALEMIRAEGGAEYCFRKQAVASTKEQPSKQWEGGADGVEKWIEVVTGTVTLCGRLDYYIDGVLIDFKSGVARAWHMEQMAFYCALIHRKFGRLPKSAKVYYSGSGVSVDALVPSENECGALLLRYAQMAEIAAVKLGMGRVEALPERDNCLFCPCKFNCDAYWMVVVPQLMADPELSVVDAVGDENATVSTTSSFSSVNFTAEYGTVEILFPHHTHSGIADCDLRHCRVLHARKRLRGELVSIVLNEQSEVLVVQDC